MTIKTPQVLAARTVLIVEDQYIIADEMRRAVQALGGRVSGPVPSVEKARELLREQTVDLAVLDVTLGSAKVFPLAEELIELSVPFLFATGHEASEVPSHLLAAPLLEKPVTLRNFAEVVDRLLN